MITVTTIMTDFYVQEFTPVRAPSVGLVWTLRHSKRRPASYVSASSKRPMQTHLLLLLLLLSLQRLATAGSRRVGTNGVETGGSVINELLEPPSGATQNKAIK